MSSSTRWRTQRRHRAGDERELLFRLRKTCEGGLIANELTEAEDELENRLLADARVVRRRRAAAANRAGEAGRAAVVRRPRGARTRSRRRRASRSIPTGSSCSRVAMRSPPSFRGSPAPSSGTRTRRGSRSASCPRRSSGRASHSTAATRLCARSGSTACSAPSAQMVPTSAHSAYVRRLSPLEATYTKERATAVCLETLQALGFDLAAQPNIRLDLDDRPQKSPRACVIASDPPKVVHLITRAQGGLHDYQAFLHEAGHALHYGGCDPSLPTPSGGSPATTRSPRSTRTSSRRSPRSRRGTSSTSGCPPRRRARTPRRRCSSRRSCSAATRRSCVSSSTSGRASQRTAARPTGYADRLTAATGYRYRPEGHLGDMDEGFYSADYLRAWIRSAQLRSHLVAEVGDDWWRNPATGDLLRACSARARSRRARRSRGGSGSSRSTRRRSSHELGA